MSETPHLDEVERLRAALWGGGAAAEHLAACDSCREDVAWHRRLRDTFRRWSAAAPAESAVEALRQAARCEVDVPAIEWLRATPLPALAGVRSATESDLHVVCEAAGLHVDVVLHPTGAVGRFALSGQVMDAESRPATDTPVTLFVDRRRQTSATTDDFGEFTFDAVRGERFGLRIGAGDEATHVEILPAGEAQ